MVKCTGRGLVVKRPGVLSKVQMLTLVLGVGVFSLLPTNVMLGQGCVRALLGEQFISTSSGFRMGSCQWAGTGPKVGQKWVFGCKSGSKWVRTHFCTHLKPISGFSRKPTFYPVEGGGIVF